MAVSTIKASGGDYTSLSAWESAKQADLTGLGPEEAECYNFSDTTACNINGWTTTASDYIRIYTPAAERHDGTAGTGYRIGGALSGGTISINEAYVRIEGVEVYNDPAATNGDCINALVGTDIRIDDCLLHDGDRDLFLAFDFSGTVTITNTIGYTAGRFGFNVGGTTKPTVKCRFVTAAGATNDNFNDVDCKNCLSVGATQKDYETNCTGDYNGASDTTSSIFTNNVQSIVAASEFVDYTNKDFHLASGSASEASGSYAGTLGQDANGGDIAFDIDEDSRDGTTPDLGADEFVSASGGKPWLYYRNMIQQGF